MYTNLSYTYNVCTYISVTKFRILAMQCSVLMASSAVAAWIDIMKFGRCAEWCSMTLQV